MTEKLCTRCHGPNDSEFKQCKPCRVKHRIVTKRYTKAHPERVRESSYKQYWKNPEYYSNYAKTHKDRINDHVRRKREVWQVTEGICNHCGKPHNEDSLWCFDCKEWKRKHNKEYYPIDKEKDKARSKKWRKKNPDKVKETNAKRYLVDPIKYRTQVKQWAHKNPGRRRAISIRYAHNRRARIEGNGGSYTTDELNALMVSQGYSCFYCDKPFFHNTLDTKVHIDHMTPISRGGSNDISNIALSCPHCNLSKNARTAEEFMLLLKR